MSIIDASMTVSTFSQSSQRWDLVDWEPITTRWVGPSGCIEHNYVGIGGGDYTAVVTYVVEFWDAKGRLLGCTYVAAT